MKYLVLSFVFLITLQPSMAQGNGVFEKYQKEKEKERKQYTDRKQKELQAYLEKKRKEFDAYRKKKNEEFAAYIGRPWTAFDIHKGIPAPKRPDPKKPTIAPKGKSSSEPIEIPHGDIKPVIIPQKEEPLDIPLPEQSPYQQQANIQLFNTSVYVGLGSRLKFEMNGITEKDIERIWKRLSSDDYTPLFEDCARICQEKHLNGWATLNLCKTVSEQLLGEKTNEAAVLQTYLMAELGYDALIVRVGSSRLVSACPADVPLCLINFILKDKKRYYLWADVPIGAELYTYKNNYATATRAIDFSNAYAIDLDKQTDISRTFMSKLDNNLKVTVNIKKSLKEYYKDIPLINDWSFYARQPMDNDLKVQLIPALRNAISGKSETEAANILLHFVQTAFEYKTDEEQFGHEKTDFKEELFYHDACDCEDRSILYSDLVRTLLGLDVVLLHYPNHLCTAVKFKQEVGRHHIKLGGAVYTICDPTYINASIGTCMPNFVNVRATVYKTK